MRQGRGGVVQCLEAEVHAGSDHPVDISPVAGHDIKGCGGSEIHDDQIPAVKIVTGHGIYQPVRPHGRTGVDTDIDRQ